RRFSWARSGLLNMGGVRSGSAQPLGLPADQVPAGAVDMPGMITPITSAIDVDFSAVHNYYEWPVFEAVLQRASDYPYLDAQALPDVACVALNRVGPRYILHAVDLTFHLTNKERAAMEENLHDAVTYAFEFVQARMRPGAE
ncbi:MAG: late competence development ComFB family protein, partial [Gammaproteobacteria bacterium]